MAGDDPGLGRLGRDLDRNTDEAGLTQADYLKAAFGWQYNWIGLAGAVAFAVVSGSALPLLLAAGLELMYLSAVPQNARFRRLVRSWKLAEEKRSRELALSALYRELPAPMQARYAELVRTAAAIRSNYQKSGAATQVFARPLEQKLDGLLQAYLRLLHSAFSHREYLATTDVDQIRRELTSLESSLEGAAPRVQEINRKRIEINRKRVAKYEKIRENRDVIDAQCAAVEDVLSLIRDQSVTVRDPEQVSAQLDHLVEGVETTEQNLREMEELFSAAIPELPEELALPQPGEQSRAAPRVRHRN